MIGNDIIDLNVAATESDWQRKGFLEKQFTEEEQTLIKNAEDSFEKVWLLWSMKESAYKIWARKNQKRRFAPLKFECKLTSEDAGEVFFENQKVYTTSIIDGYFIFTVATLQKKTKAYSSIGSPFNIEKDLKNKISEETGVPILEIEQKKSETGIPSYYYKNKLLTKSCSISHHGNYGAFSLLEL